MSQSVNKVIVLGNLGTDGELIVTKNGANILKFRVATTESWNDKNTGLKNEKTEWHQCSMFGDRAGKIVSFIKKGDPIYVEGKLETTSYEKDGIKRYTTGIIVTEVKLLGRRDRQESSGSPVPFSVDESI